MKSYSTFKLFISTLFLTVSSSLFAATPSPINALLHDPQSPVAGNPKGTVTVVEFFDYQCSHCVAMAPTVAQLIQNNHNVRVVFKEFPIRGPVSEFASRAALAANMQGKYYGFSHDLLTYAEPLSNDTILDLAQKADLNVDKLKTDMKSSAISRELKNNYALAQTLKLPGTPAFFVGRTNAASVESLKYLPGEVSLSELQDAVNGV